MPSDEVTTAEIDITADGRYRIASNRGHNSLAVFAVAADGRLTHRASYPAEPVPRFFGIDSHKPLGSLGGVADRMRGHVQPRR